jgi:disulfide bond formation protein DsbB
MSQFSLYLSLVLSAATLLVHLAFVACALSLIYMPWRARVASLVERYSPYTLWAGFATSVIAVALSLVYSNIIGYPPCDLCWWQRVFLYPQAVIFAVALFARKDEASAAIALKSSLVLSTLGIAIAAFQYYGQIWNPHILGACQSTGVSCAKIYFTHFGYITLPLMSLTAYAVLMALALLPSIARRAVKNQ